MSRSHNRRRGSSPYRRPCPLPPYHRVVAVTKVSLRGATGEIQACRSGRYDFHRTPRRHDPYTSDLGYLAIDRNGLV